MLKGAKGRILSRVNDRPIMLWAVSYAPEKLSNSLLGNCATTCCTNSAPGRKQQRPLREVAHGVAVRPSVFGKFHLGGELEHQPLNSAATESALFAASIIYMLQLGATLFGNQDDLSRLVVTIQSEMEKSQFK